MTRPPFFLPWLRLQLLVRAITTTRWDAATWPVAKAQLRRALELRRKVVRDGWFNLLAWLLCAWVLAGCMATNQEQWSRSPEDPSVKRAIYECKADADAVSHRATTFGGAIMPIVGLFQRRSTFDECMESRGYLKSR